VIYPAIPWFGVMCLGYGLGVVFQLPERPRRLILLAIGLAAVGLFVALRMINGYGDPAPWATQKSGVFTALSFLKVSKYPPSLDFVAVTLGLALLIGLWLEGLKGFTPRLLLTFGRTPLFTYLLHIFLIHGLALLVGLGQGLPAGLFTHFIEGPPKGLAAAHWGFHTGTVLLIWLAVVLALYPMSRAYMRLKQTRRAAWMSYL
jgi:hypothetical protein